ncbi:phage tail assembly chaperone [Providencia sp. PROV147]|uniref:phage tail assembly chaperone n=1 Tax=Providencia sp. PROV147 TaxID=2949857 RepID=UPI00227415EC|nr:phage tail assembly chaperone [Providencia sp. PROV147]MCY0801195.1 phage tail protein [Providencia rettgeri]
MSKPNLRNLALSATHSYRTKKVIVPEWDNAEVLVREPSIQSRMKCAEFMNDKEGEELTSTQKALRNIEGDSFLLIHVLLDTDGNPVFTEDDQPELFKTYGPVHSRLVAEAFSLTISAAEAEKK